MKKAGFTSFVQWLDTSFFALSKGLYRQRYSEFVLTPQSHKINASQRRVLMTRWVADAFTEALTKVDVAKGFRKLGYMFTDDASFNPKIRDFECALDPDVVPVPLRSVANPAPGSRGAGE